MKTHEIKKLLTSGEAEGLSGLYGDTAAAVKRILSAVEEYEKTYGAGREVTVISVPGRSEICGNHTDHNHGEVIAAGVDRDIIAVAGIRDDGLIKTSSQGYRESVIRLADIKSGEKLRKFTSDALIAGMVNGFTLRGYPVCAFDAVIISDVPKGSGLSSSAAYEVTVGSILSHLAGDGKIPREEIAKIAQYAENVYFGKPSGLMDQMACALGGFVWMDFRDPEHPEVEPTGFAPTDDGLTLCIVNTGGSHADLNDDYAAVPAEMKRVAHDLGAGVLRGIDEKTVTAHLPALRSGMGGDRAVLRALHFIHENERVERMRACLKAHDTDGFLAVVTESGNSSFKYLQNLYSPKNPDEQGLPLALALTESFLSGRRGACRVHGGGFAGTIQAYIPDEDAKEYTRLMDAVFGEGATLRLRVRDGARRLF